MLNRCEHCGKLFEDEFKLAYCSPAHRIAARDRNRPAPVIRKPKPTFSTDAAWREYAAVAAQTATDKQPFRPPLV